MSTLHDDEMVVVRSLKAAFEQFGSPGSSMNSAGQNPFFIDARGAFDLLKSAKLVITNLDNHRALKAAAAKQEVERIEAVQKETAVKAAQEAATAAAAKVEEAAAAALVDASNAGNTDLS
jgi:hypothetical protein